MKSEVRNGCLSFFREPDSGTRRSTDAAMGSGRRTVRIQSCRASLTDALTPHHTLGTVDCRDTSQEERSDSRGLQGLSFLKLREKLHSALAF